MHKETFVLSGEDIRKIILKVGQDEFMDKVIDAVMESFSLFQAGKIDNPRRSGFYFDGDLIEFMPANLEDNGVCMKIVNYHGENDRVFLPSIIATLVYLDRKTGFPLAIADATLLTAIRTGAASAVATKYLADLSTRVVGLVGNGSQAMTQLHALSRVLDIRKVLLFDIQRSRSINFAKQASNLFPGVDMEISSAQKLCGKSGVISTCTPMRRDEPPVITSSWISAGVHINAVGADDPGKGELDVELLNRAKVVPDCWIQARFSGECQGLLGKSIYAELGEIITGKKPGRERQDEVTIFDSTGTAFEDLMVFKVVMKLAKELGVGESKSLIDIPSDSFNPYSVFRHSEM